MTPALRLTVPLLFLLTPALVAPASGTRGASAEARYRQERGERLVRRLAAVAGLARRDSAEGNAPSHTPIRRVLSLLGADVTGVDPKDLWIAAERLEARLAARRRAGGGSRSASGTGAIQGTVRVAGGSVPLSGIYVYVYSSNGSFVGAASTDASGSYTVSGLSAGTYYAQTASTQGYVDELYDNIPCMIFCNLTIGTPISVQEGSATAGIDFGLAAGGTIAGRVTDAAAAGIANAYLYVYDSSGQIAGFGVSNSAGEYATTSGLLSGIYYVRTANQSGLIDELYDNVPCPVQCTVTSGTPVAVQQGGQTSGIDFTLAPGGRIAGQVTSAATSAPLAYVSIFIHDAGGSYVSWASTDASGAYLTTAGLPSGTYYARTGGSGGYIDELYRDIPCPAYCGVTQGTPITVAAGATTSGIDFALDVGGRVSGTVSAPSGAAVGVEVQVYDVAGSFVASAVTDGAGAYATSQGLPSGSYRARTFNYQGFIDELYDDIPCVGYCNVTQGMPIAVVAGSTTAGIDFALAAGGRISGHLGSAATGAPISGSALEVYAPTGLWVTSAWTDASGAYLTNIGLPSGTFYARTHVQRGYIDELYDDIPCPFVCNVAAGTPISVAAGSTTTGVDFALQPKQVDFDGDGKTDILFRHRLTGENLVWFMNGTQRTGSATVTPLPDTSWAVAGTADFDWDAKPDILWRHAASGKVVVWSMDGITRTSGAFTSPSGAADPDWKIAGTGDFDGYGTDILWHHGRSGKNAVWLMDGTTRRQAVFTSPDAVADTRWSLSGSGDFNGDKRPDLLWRHAVTGKIAVWMMSGVSRIAGAFTNPPAVTDTHWQIAGVGDYDGDEKADILWRNGSSGKMVIWFMNGITRTAAASTNPSALPDTNWVIVGPR